MAEDLTREVAARLGVTPTQIKKAEEARGLAERAERLREVLAAWRTAEQNLPRMARELAGDQDPKLAARVAELLGLVEGDGTVSEAVTALRRLGSVADLPTAKTKPARRASVMRPLRQLSETSQRVIAYVGEEGPQTSRDVAEALGMDARGSHAVMSNLARAGRLRRLDDGRYELAVSDGRDES